MFLRPTPGVTEELARSSHETNHTECNTNTEDLLLLIHSAYISPTACGFSGVALSSVVSIASLHTHAPNTRDVLRLSKSHVTVYFRIYPVGSRSAFC